MGCLRAFVYLVFGLVVLAVAVVLLVIAIEEPAPGTPCKMLGETVVRDQNGSRLQCVKNVETGRLYWRAVKGN